MDYNFYLEPLKRVFAEHNLTLNEDLIPKDMWYPDTTPDGFISYLRERDVDGFFDSDSRTNYRLKKEQKIKPGKYLYKLGITDIDVVNKLVASLKPPEIMIISGNYIPWAYHGVNYMTDTGSLGSSCMRETNKQGFFEVYKNARMIVAVQGDKIFARAVVWDNVILENGKKIILMDRIYGKERFQYAFKDYATKHGWHHKYEQSYSCDELVDPKGKRVAGHMSTIKLEHPVPYYAPKPYMDTYPGFLAKDELVTHLKATEMSGVQGFRGTGGTFPKRCKVCNSIADYTKGLCTEHKDYSRENLTAVCPYCGETYTVNYFGEQHQACIPERMYKCKEHDVFHIADTKEELEACSCGGKHDSILDIS